MIKSFVAKALESKYDLYKKIGRRVWKIEEFSHSQNCEDIILDRLVNKIAGDGPNKGFYVDIGAHHPVRFSNTFRFYEQGWTGINVDPLPHVMELFNKYRPRDINLNIGCGEEAGKLSYYSFEEPAYNTLNEDVAKRLLNDHTTRLKEKINVDILPLSIIFAKHLGKNEIDFLDLDVESYEIHVLKGNDWNKYRPKIIVMESWTDGIADIRDVFNDGAITYLNTKGYRVVSRAFNAVFLVDEKIM